MPQAPVQKNVQPKIRIYRYSTINVVVYHQINSFRRRQSMYRIEAKGRLSDCIVSIDPILALIAPHIFRVWGRNIHSDAMPDISDLQAICKHLKDTASFNGQIITFNGNGGVTELPVFNYLVLSCEKPFTEQHDIDGWITSARWRITGFASSAQIAAFFNNEMPPNCVKIYTLSVERLTYFDTPYHFLYVTPAGDRIYTNERGYFHTYANALDHLYQEPDFEYQIEIDNLYELTDQGEFYPFICPSLDDFIESFSFYLYLSPWRGNSTPLNANKKCRVSHRGESLHLEYTRKEVGYDYAITNHTGTPYCSDVRKFITCSACELRLNCRESG